MALLTSRQEIKDTLVSAKTIAVLGAHVQSYRAACYVPDYLFARGYRILPVNPALVGEVRWGESFVATLADLKEPVDLVDVFRRSDALPDHLPDLLAMRPKPSVVWFQLGIRNDEVAQALVEGGLDVVQDRCTLADHRTFGLGR